MTGCPACGSNATRKSSAVHAHGTSTIERRGRGIALTRGGPRIWRSRSTSVRMTSAAARNAPPVPMAEALTFIGTLVVAEWIVLSSADDLSAFLMAIPTAAVVAIIATAIVAYLRQDQRRAAHADYERQWYCLRCGTLFRADPALPPGESGAKPIAGPAPAGRSGRERMAYASRILEPIQRAKAETQRDGEWLRIIAARADRTDSAFDPCLPVPLDLGAVSRLASLGYLEYDRAADIFAISASGAERLRQMTGAGTGASDRARSAALRPPF